MQEQTSEKEEPCVRVFLLDESEPCFEYDPNCNTVFVVNQISEERRVKGYLTIRNKSRRRVGTVTLEAGDYDFHITEQTPPQQQGGQSQTELALISKGIADLALEVKSVTADLALEVKSVQFGLNEVKDEVHSTNLTVHTVKGDVATLFSKLTPSNACKTEYAHEFLRLVAALQLADTPYLSNIIVAGTHVCDQTFKNFKFSWQNVTFSKENEENEVKILEKTAYAPLNDYLRDLGYFSFIVGDGKDCLGSEKILFRSDIFTLRPNLFGSAKDYKNTPFQVNLIQSLQGRTDLIIVREDVANVRPHSKYQVCVAIEVKTSYKFHVDNFLREAVTQLIGLNVENFKESPSVILTNLAGQHFVAFLDLNCKYELRIHSFGQFVDALTFAMSLSERQPFSSNFCRRPTPEPSVAGDEEQETASV